MPTAALDCQASPNAGSLDAPGPSWPALTGALVLIVLAVRIVYLMWFCPLELVGDEAYYWEWSRHLDLCYYEKGPGLAYLIAPSVRLFGVSEWAVRLPMALCAAGATWALARLTASSTGNERAGFLAALCFSLLPAFQANAQICTQDGPLILCWVLLAAAGLRLMRHWDADRDTLPDWLLLAALLGVGFLFKQSVLLFLPTLALYWLLRRKSLRWSLRRLGRAILAAACFALVVSPVIVWNARHHWPTVAHTLGHLGSPYGDEQPHSGFAYRPKWTLSFLGAQLGAIGPGAIVLMGMACVWAIRSRTTDSRRWLARLWMLCCALPSIAFFLALTLRKEVLGNWPFPAFTTLIVLVADLAVIELPRFSGLVAAWRALAEPRPKAGLFRRRPETPFRSCWDLMIGYGLAAWVVLSFPTLLGKVPWVNRKLAPAIVKRFSGHRAHARELDAVRERLREEGNPEPLIVTRYYMTASLYAFYLPDHPCVYNAGGALGRRSSSYDFWPDTDLADTRLHGRRVLFDGQSGQKWPGVFFLGACRPIEGGKYYLGEAYGGPRQRVRPGLSPPERAADEEP